MKFRNIAAVAFDMDGTLLDSEGRTEAVIASYLASRGVSAAPISAIDVHGVTWEAIGDLLAQRHSELQGRAVAEDLQAAFHESFLAELPNQVTGAREAIRAAAEHHAVGIVTSSNRETVEAVIDGLALHDTELLTVCAEDCERSKPDPQAYELAAARFAVAPERCLVFEDSSAGLRAARGAGMPTVAIARNRRGAEREAIASLADWTIDDFMALPAGFFSEIGLVVSA